MLPEIVVGAGLSGVSGIAATIYIVKNLEEKRDAELRNKAFLSEMKLNQSLQQQDANIEEEFRQFFEKSGGFSIGAINMFESAYIEEPLEQGTTSTLNDKEIVLGWEEN